MTAALFRTLGELAAAGSPVTLPLPTLEALAAAGFSPDELRRALLLAQALADAPSPAEALTRYEAARRWTAWPRPEPALSPEPSLRVVNGEEAR